MIKPIILGAAGLLVLAGLPVSPSFAWEMVCYLIVFGFLLWQKPLVNTFLALDLPRRILPGSFVLVMLAVTLIFLLAYTLLATRRLCVGGLGIFLDDTILYHIGLRAAAPGGFPIPLGLYLLECPEPRLLLQVSYPVVTLFELLSPLCLFSRCFRRAWIAVILSFHLGTWLLMGIFFPMFVLIILVFLTDIDSLISLVFNRHSA